MHGGTPDMASNSRCSSRLFFGSLPSLSCLEVVEGQPLRCSTLPQVKAKCRELVRADSQLLCAPAVTHGAAYLNIRIVAKNGYISGNNGVQQKLANSQIKILRTVPLSVECVLQCYRFTLTARLAPKWNIIADWIVKGCDVYHTGRGQCLKLDVGMTTREITISVTAYKMTINFLKPDDLHITTTLLNQFKTNPHTTIQETSISNNRCYVLPNFTQAHVFCASHSIPSSSSFNSYDKIRLHWKKQYGCILPESQHLFYQIYFKFNPGSFFSYPGCCVATGTPVVCPARDADHVTTSFINDIHSRMPSLCGDRVVYSSRPLIPINALQTVPQLTARPNTNPPPTHQGGVAHPISLIEHILPGNPPPPSVTTPTNTDDATVPSYTATPLVNKATPTIVSMATTSKPQFISTVKTSTYKATPTKRPLSTKPHPLPKRPCSNHDDTTRLVPSLTEPIITDPTIPPANTPNFDKMKVSDLKAWLKQHGVPYTSKEKKDVLVKKAMGCHGNQ